MKTKLFLSIAAVFFSFTSFCQSNASNQTDTSKWNKTGQVHSQKKSSKKTPTNTSVARPGAGDITSPGNSTSSDSSVISNGTNGIDRTIKNDSATSGNKQ